jgi:guanylate kinase
MNNKKIIIILGPSGAGKSTLLDRCLAQFPQLRDTVTYTTRPMREGESEGHPYHFVTAARFQELIQQNFFVEWAKVHTQFYGTPLHQLEDAWAEKKTIIMDVDVQGAQTFKAKYPQAVTIFILPPSIDVLRQRILQRAASPPPDLEVRLQNAVNEMKMAPKCDHTLVNDQIDKAYASLTKIIEKILEPR